MMGRASHLHDERLVEHYLADRLGEPLDPPTAEHLAECGACQARYGELSVFLGDLRDNAEREADEIFTPEVLRRQQEHVLRRLDHASRSGRVISFPSRVASRISTGTSRVAPRWLAAAAAAGLFVGVAVGGAFTQPGLRRTVTASRQVPQPVATRLMPAPMARPTAPAVMMDTTDDDTFLEELEAALQRPHTRELQPFDALTPHVREIGNRVQ